MVNADGSEALMAAVGRKMDPDTRTRLEDREEAKAVQKRLKRAERWPYQTEADGNPFRDDKPQRRKDKKSSSSLPPNDGPGNGIAG